MINNLKRQLREEIKKGSVYSLASDADLFQKVIIEMTKPFKNKGITKVIAPEMKGLFYGPIIAYNLKLPFVAVLRKERLSKKDVLISYKDYSKKSKKLGIEKKSIKKRDKILLVDDIFETGGTGRAVIKLIGKTGARIKGISTIYNKLNERDANFFKKYNFHYLIRK